MSTISKSLNNVILKSTWQAITELKDKDGNKVIQEGASYEFYKNNEKSVQVYVGDTKPAENITNYTIVNINSLVANKFNWDGDLSSMPFVRGFEQDELLVNICLKK